MNQKDIKSLPDRAIPQGATKAYSGARFDVYNLTRTGENGNIIQRDLVDHPGAVVILPLLDHEHLILIRNERFSVGQTLWELPAGTLEPKESPDKTAARELIEETGYQAQHIELLTNFYTSPGICNERMFAYIAKDLTFVGQALEENEKITTEIVKWKDALAMVKEGTICDGKTLATLLFYKTFFC